jgi:hypothetical protein
MIPPVTQLDAVLQLNTMLQLNPVPQLDSVTRPSSILWAKTRFRRREKEGQPCAAPHACCHYVPFFFFLFGNIVNSSIFYGSLL